MDLCYLSYSFDWHEKMLEKAIKTELQMQEYLKTMDKAMEAIRGIDYFINEFYLCKLFDHAVSHNAYMSLNQSI